jgi:hypothetical protein
MDTTKRNRTSKKLRYFFLNDKVHKVLKLSRAHDQLIAWSYPDGKRVLYSYQQAKSQMENAYTIQEVASIIGRHKVTIEDYILDGKIKMPQRIYPIGNKESSWSKFMFNQKDIMDLHEYILEAGYTKNLPSRAELLALLKNGLMLYTKTTDGSFVPVWRAE